MRILAIVLLLAGSAHAGDVYVWIDSDGRRQISDAVPERYRAKAKRVEVLQAEVAPVDTRSAAAGGTAQPGIAPQVSQQDAATTACYLAWQRYNDSLDCLILFERDPRANCPVVPAPAANCPPP